MAHDKKSRSPEGDDREQEKETGESEEGDAPKPTAEDAAEDQGAGKGQGVERPDGEGADDPEGDRAPEGSWAAKVRRARELWEAGNNAELRALLDELEKAPAEEAEAREVAAELRQRLSPDPIAIALWLVTLVVFCFLSYWFVIR